jgi:hypothetical protein
MTAIEFEQALDRWGANLDDWPPELAARGRDRLANDLDARRQLTAARTVDDALLALQPHRAPAHLAMRIAASAPRQDGLDRALNWLTERLWRPAMLALVLAVGGYLAGISVSDPLDPTLADDVMSLAFNDLYAELDDAP